VAGGGADTGPRVSDRPAVFLVNPASANGRTGKIWPALRRRARRSASRGEPPCPNAGATSPSWHRDAAAEGRLLSSSSAATGR
jgi:hypothetical protein